ncbi:DUF5685 family protein [Actinorugispora endophytica]|uniref:Regulatory protein n=1 Tax=Actinorugispora endophytica TaxID=1605990 RepID=A0A4V3D734_9ACTN|nr:DUF5685 family protein [Actinorugispora endophytica]TDQ46357.1 hypothetical protein EV190_12544 [Actinorugispora endophytica]
MFGILRPCRHSLPGDLAAAWMSHLCGLCLALRDEHGQLARVATNYDGLVVSALTAAQSEAGRGTRTAGPCPLRGMRGAEVAEGAGARLAASVSLLLAAVAVDDHVSDGDGVYGRRPVRGVARAVAGRWAVRAHASGERLGFDGGALLSVLERQRELESGVGTGDDLLAVTGPTEYATGEAFAHTAVLAGRPRNEAPLREAGRLFGRVAHLLDAVEDQEADRASGAWNPITATGTDAARVRRLCEDAVLGVRLALAEADLVDGRLVHALLVHELERAVGRVFVSAGHPRPPGGGHGGRHSHGPIGGGGAGAGGRDHPPAGGGPDGERSRMADQGGWCCTTPAAEYPPRRRGFWAGCGAALFMGCTGQLCCRDPFPGPWKGKPRESACSVLCDGCEVCSQCAEGCRACCTCGNCCRDCGGSDCSCSCD